MVEKIKKIAPHLFVFFYALFLISPSWNYYILNSYFSPFALLLSAFQFFLIAFPYLCGWVHSRTYFIVTFPFMLASLFQLAHIDIFSYELLSGGIAAIFSTSFSEASEFMHFLRAPLLVTVGVVFCLYGVGIWMAPSRLARRRWVLVSGISFCVLIIGLKSFQRRSVERGIAETLGKTYPYKTFYEGAKALAQISRFKRLVRGKQFLKLNADCSKVPEEVTHVLVIGESSSRHHWQLYGYKRKTNPELSQVKDLIVFEDVVSASNATLQSLDYSLTLKNKDRVATILTLAKECEFKTYWYSNQAMFGTFDTMTSLIGMTADEVSFLNTDTSNKSYDDKLLPYFKGAFEGDVKRKLIVLHTLGSHYYYERRYPDGWGSFSSTGEESEKEKIINDYDNSISYTDTFLAEVLQEVGKSSSPATILYFSDHGEDVFHGSDEYYGHGAPQFFSSEVEVPFLFYANSYFREQAPIILEKAQIKKERPVSLLSFFSSYAHILGISYENQGPFFKKEEERKVYNLNGLEMSYNQLKEQKGKNANNH